MVQKNNSFKFQKYLYHWKSRMEIQDLKRRMKFEKETTLAVCYQALL